VAALLLGIGPHKSVRLATRQTIGLIITRSISGHTFLHGRS